MCADTYIFFNLSCALYGNERDVINSIFCFVFFFSFGRVLGFSFKNLNDVDFMYEKNTHFNRKQRAIKKIA